MIHYLRVAGLRGLLFLVAGVMANTQAMSQVPGGIALDGGPVGAVAPAEDFFDLSSILPVDIGIGDVNGLTDRFGMPLRVPFVKGAQSTDFTAPVPNAATATARRTGAKPAAPAVKGSTKNTKGQRRTARNSGSNSSELRPKYFVPHGSIEWSPGAPMISTAPSSTYGYGYGTSGYGTEVFGDFWKGWPMVQ